MKRLYPLLSTLLLLSVGAPAWSDGDRGAVAKRIAPIGQVRVAGSAAAAPAPAVAAPAPAPVVAPAPAPAPTAAPVPVAAPVATDAGQKIYQAACFACHGTGAAGAPKLGDSALWAPRIAKGKAALYASAMNGIPGTGMMPKGACAACSEADLNAAVDYMVSQSQ
jgi:cytochrome c5